jgi:hypothetical protein
MATITSNQTGDWASTSTWVGGSVPAADDLVVIAHGHKVTVSTNIQSTRTGDVEINGNLHFANGGKMHLHGRMTVYNRSNANSSAGEFVEGSTSSGSLLSMAGGSEIKISGNNSDQHGVQINSRAWCGVEMLGSEPTHYTNLSSFHDGESPYLSVTSASNFVNGDMISLYEREVDWRVDPDECMYVHYADTTNNRIYFRQFVGPEDTIASSSGSTITVGNAKKFRVGYTVVFGNSNSNINSKVITAINGNTITFGSSVTGSVSGQKIYVSGTEKVHPSGRILRRLATTVRSAITSIDSTNQLTVGNASDLNVGDEIMVEAMTNDGTYNYVSGSESNVWRHNILYTISSISGNVLTLDRNLQYKSDLGSLVVKISRDIVVKACKTDGAEVPNGDQDSARVFFNVRYWTSTTWNAAPTRRVKIKYVRFKNLGYNTNDGTNFRAGVTIAGYNGRYHSTLNGSGADQTTIHTSSGNSQTGENYVDGCVVTAYSLCSNETRDGDSYPSLCVRHPYGHVSRNNVVCGTGNGSWRWSSGYFTKESGIISMVSNQYNHYTEAMYADYSCVQYITCRMAEDYGFRVNNIRDGYAKHVKHIDSQTHHGRAIQVGYLAVDGPLYEKWYADKYRYLGFDSSAASHTIINSQFMPNQWDQTVRYYDPSATGKIYTDRIYHWHSGYEDAFRSPGGTGIFTWAEHGFLVDEVVESRYRLTRVKKSGESDWDVLVGYDNSKNLLEKVFVPAGTTVRLQSKIYVNPKQYNRTTNASVGSTGYPVFLAKPHLGVEIWKSGRYSDGVVDFAQGESFSDTNFNSDQFLDSTEGNLATGWIEHSRHTSAALGDWETVQLVVQPQSKGYVLTYGYWIGNNSMKEEGFKMKDFEVAFETASPVGDVMIRGNATKKSVRSSFNAGKKRIGGTRL